MRSHLLIFLALASTLLLSSWKALDTNWLTEKHQKYTLSYTASDAKYTREYDGFIERGISSVEIFFKQSFRNQVAIVIHPNRRSLDSSWQKDWNMPNFKSECWMVASGVAMKLDIISPIMWDKNACEHVYGETEKTQKLITHELVHVYHGQINASPDFSNVEGLDWFVEGLATFASGQCDSERISEVKRAITQNKIPASLDNFWEGKLKYALSGSLVMYIDTTYGRAKLIELLPFSKKSEVLSKLNTTEAGLLLAWKNYMQKL
jgi:hypothetical protein